MADPTHEPSLIPAASQEAEAGENRAYQLLMSKELHDYNGLKVTAEEEKPYGRVSSKIEVTKADGSTVEVSAFDPMYKLKGETGLEVEVSVGTVQHIDSLHFKAEDAGSLLDFPSMDELMRDISRKLPADLADRPGFLTMDIEMGKHVGEEGIASLSELKSGGVLNEADLMTVEAVRAEVMALNKEGDPASKAAFTQKFKADHPECKVQFIVIRNERKDDKEVPNTGVVVPAVVSPKRPTTKLFLMLGPTNKDKVKPLYTAASGRDMPLHPLPKQHLVDGKINEKTFKASSDAWFDTVQLVG